MDYCDIEWLALVKNRNYSVIFEVELKFCLLDSFDLDSDYEGYYISSMGFLPTVVDIIVIGIKISHSHPF